MHEMSIATALMRQVLDAVATHKVARVRELEVVMGAMRRVVPEALRMAFEVVSEGTSAEGAALKITEEPARAKCRACGRTLDRNSQSRMCSTARRAMRA